MTAPTLEGVWSLAVLRHCTDTHGVMCWGCGRRAHRIGTTPTAGSNDSASHRTASPARSPRASREPHPPSPHRPPSPRTLVVPPLRTARGRRLRSPRNGPSGPPPLPPGRRWAAARRRREALAALGKVVAPLSGRSRQDYPEHSNAYVPGGDITAPRVAP